MADLEVCQMNLLLNCQMHSKPLVEDKLMNGLGSEMLISSKEGTLTSLFTYAKPIYLWAYKCACLVPFAYKCKVGQKRFKNT